MKHRLFVGLRPPREIRAALLGTMQGIEGARWQDDAQLHLTLRYIGEVDSHRADDIAGELAAIRFAPFDLRIAGVGLFERKGVAHTLWAGLAPSDALAVLQRKVERAVVRAGLAPESRRFHPHVTLARLNRASGPADHFAARNAALALGPWQVEVFVLYESELHPGGSVYTPALRYPARG